MTAGVAGLVEASLRPRRSRLAERLAGAPAEASAADGDDVAGAEDVATFWPSSKDVMAKIATSGIRRDAMRAVMAVLLKEERAS